MLNRPLRPWVKNALVVVCTAFVGAFSYIGITGFDARLQAVESRPAQPKLVIITPTIEPTASPTASLKFIQKVKPTVIKQ